MSAVIESKHTPGPWDYDYAPNGDDFYVMTPTVGLIAMVGLDEEKGIVGAQVEANARLIAAAPDLLKAAKALIAVLNNAPLRSMALSLNLPLYETAAEMLDAIGKAEGRNS